MGIILFVCPDKSLETQIKDTIAAKDNQVEVITSSQDSFEEDLKKIDREITLIVSRGKLGRYIAEHYKYHVIFLHVSIADVLIQIKELKSIGAKKIAVLGTKSWIETDPRKLTEDVVGCDFIITEDSETRVNILKNLPEMGYDAVITVERDQPIARSLGLQCMSLMTSADSILAGYNEAKFVANVIHIEALRTTQLTTLLNTAVDAYVMLSANEVTYANNMAYRLFNKKNIDITDIQPFLLMHNVPRKINDTMVLVNATSYRITDDEYGYMISFKDASNIRRSEQIIRRSLLQGFTAKNTFSNIYSESMTMKHCIDVAKQYAQYSSTILITGETGTGKELFAQSIHNASSRKNQPFVSINCASMSKGMLENELFGRVESNSAAGRKPGKYGLFELAHGGTLFLDEISELPIDIQARLLRVLQEKELFRIGDDKQIPVDVRVICSTNKDLIKCIEDGSFRSDLYYRINIMNLNIPPLRARKADIIPLFKYFIHMYSIKYGIDAKLDEKQCKNLLEGYNWPGNTRELMSMAERCVILCSTGIITESFLADILTSESELTSESTNTAKIPKKRRKPQKNEIERLLKVYKKQDVCNILGISRTTLWRLLKDD